MILTFTSIELSKDKEEEEEKLLFSLSRESSSTFMALSEEKPRSVSSEKCVGDAKETQSSSAHYIDGDDGSVEEEDRASRVFSKQNEKPK